MICQLPNKTEDETLFDVIFFGPMFSTERKTKNKTEPKNLTSLSLSFDDGFKVTKLRGITGPGISIRQKLADSEIICVWTYKKVPQIILCDPELLINILDDYDDYLLSRVK